MIRVLIDMTRADAAEREVFLSLPGVARALDTFALAPRESIQLTLDADESARADARGAVGSELYA